VPEVGLQRPRIDPVIRQFEAAGMPQYVGVHFNSQVGGSVGTLDHPVEALGRQGSPALRHKHEPG